MKSSAAFTPSWILSRRVTSFQKFFELGKEESASPFLDSRGKRISRNLFLKASITSACLLFVSFLLKLLYVEPYFVFPLAFVYLLSGTPALIASAEDIFSRRTINIDTLTTLAAFCALGIGSPIEGALLLVLFALAGAIEDVVTLRAKGALSDINELAPTKAYVVEEGGELIERAVHDVHVGETLAIRSGEIVPLDGVVRSGEASVSFAHLTGESKPIHVSPGKTLSSGTRVTDGYIAIEVTCTSHDSTVTKLIHLITRAHASKPKIAKVFDSFGRIYSLSVIGLSFLIALILPLFGIPFLNGSGSLLRAVNFLITASPCALILAVPISYLSSLGSAVTRGAVLKGSTVLDGLLSCTTIAFDKTGTLSKGKLALTKITPLTPSSTKDTDEVLKLGASLERYAVHPIASAIVETYAQKKEPFLECTEVKVIPGKGVEALLQGKRLFLGGSTITEYQHTVEEAKLQGCSVAILQIDENEAYLFSLQDEVRKESSSVITTLRNQGRSVIMLTGDHAATAKAYSLPLNEIYADLSPEDKLNLVTSISQKEGLLMVGDGINDAPALARATVSASMGELSSATAREASDIILLHNDLTALPWLFIKARTTRTIITQNLTLALTSILIGTTTSIIGALPLWLAVIIHEGSTLLVGLNALRLLRKGDLPPSPPAEGQSPSDSLRDEKDLP